MDWSKFNNLGILIVDDDQFTRELIESILKKIPNGTIYQASNGKEALAIINENKLDLLFLDLYMPSMNGKEFMDELNENNRDRTFVITLITTDRLIREELADIGADNYLTKPFDFQGFLEKTYSFLEKNIK